jgi:soluble lytic murein transglycosylase-like protein
MFQSLFDNKVQSIMYQMMTQLMEKMESSSKKSTATTGGTTSTTNDPNVGGGRNTVGVSETPVSGDFASLINQAAAKYDVSPTLVKAVIKAESNFNAQAVSSCGAQGLMQLMPATARSLGVDNPLDPAQNIEGGVKFLSSLLKRYNGNVQYALAAYNAGPGAVDRAGGIPAYRETQVYVQRIMSYLQSSSEWSG